MKMKLQIFDLSVYNYDFTFKWESFRDKVNLKALKEIPKRGSPLVNATVKKLCVLSPEKLESLFYSAHWVNLFMKGNPNNPNNDPFCSIGVADSKPYWRTTLYPDYKGGRPSKPQGLTLCAEVSRQVSKVMNIPVLEYPGYEADDMAALVVKFHILAKHDPSLNQWNSIDHIFLNTVDSDWIQLVSPTVTWVNTAHWTPVIRDLEGSLEWIKKRLKVDLEHPQDIVPIKCIQGDKSDNLPPNTPAYLIDLGNPHPDYNLMNSETTLEFLRELDFSSQSKDLTLYRLAQKTQRGLEDLENALKAYSEGIL